MKVWILIFVCMFSMPLLVAVLHFRMRKGQRSIGACTMKSAISGFF